MDETIISRETIRAKARRAFDRGARREDHGFNWHSRDAIETWQGEWDRKYAEWAQAHCRMRGNQVLEAA
jgi:hypothetical protein